MRTQNRSSSQWSIVLAGGDGTRLQPSIQKWLGYPMPKQYCTFTGTRSMLQHTWDRANQIVRPGQKVTILSSTHPQRSIAHLLGHCEEGTLLFQPRNCDTAPGVFLPLTYLRAWDPHAVVAIFPSDHFIFPEAPFVETVRRAVRVATLWRDRIILLGVRPSHLELDYGCIVPGGIAGWSEGSCIRHIQEFVEKPEALEGEQLLNHGALWNTLVLVAPVETLWNAGWACVPEVMERVDHLRHAIGTPEEGSVLQTIYRDMPTCNFSREVLQPLSKEVGVMELDHVLWSDWGRPERILETLQAVGMRPTFPTDVFRAPQTPGTVPPEFEVA